MLVSLGITVLFIPMALYLIYGLVINPTIGIGEVCIGFVGCFAFGTGLFNIVAAWIHQYLGHKVTIICLLGGAALITLSILI